MEYNLSELKKKNVINVEDGKNLGKITDIVLTYPEGVWKSVIVGDKVKSIFSGEKYIINLCCVSKIGDDAILVSLTPPPEVNSEEICE